MTSLLYTDPAQLFESAFDQLPRWRQWEFLHLQSHHLFQSIVNLDVLDKASKLRLYRCSNLSSMRVSWRAIAQLNRLIDLSLRISKSQSSKLKRVEVKHLDGYIREYLELHRLILNELNQAVCTQCHRVVMKRYESHRYFSVPEVKDFAKKASSVSGIYSLVIHGSLATMDYTEFSDIDTFVIFGRNLEEYPEFLLEAIHDLYLASSYFYRFDPFQHHRYFACLESELQCYNQSFLPVEVFKHGISLVGPQSIEFKTYDSRLSHVYMLHQSLRYVLKETLNLRQTDFTNKYRWKYYLATIYLLPVLYLETRGIYVYKRESFVLIKNWVDQELHNYLDRCSILRADWNKTLSKVEKLWKFVFLDLALNPMVYEFIMKFFSSRINVKHYIWVLDGAKRLCEYFFNELEALYREVGICLD